MNCILYMQFSVHVRKCIHAFPQRVEGNDYDERRLALLHELHETEKSFVCVLDLVAKVT